VNHMILSICAILDFFLFVDNCFNGNALGAIVCAGAFASCVVLGALLRQSDTVIK